MEEINMYNEQVFEEIKHINKEDIEFWYARELQFVLQYTEWRNFLKIIEKAKTTCVTSENT